MQHGLSPLPPRQAGNIEVDQDIPAYLVTEKRGFFDDADHLWAKGEMIYWEGTPSPGFEPLNELAEERLREYFTMLDKKAEEVAAKNGTSHASMVNAYESRLRLQEMDRKFGNSVDQEETMPIMQAKKEKRMARSVNDVRSTPMMRGQRYPTKRTKETASKATAADKDPFTS